MIRILAHRGYWNEETEKNTSKAIRMALEYGFGFESDVRDYCGRMIISHNIANSSCLDAEKVFMWLHEFGDKFTFAINIKADGLREMIKRYLALYKIKNYFLFDMSVPQMIEFRDEGLRYFTRQSEVEPEPCMYDDAAGVWIDSFWSVDWVTKELLEGHIKKEKEICIVSPELHGNQNYMGFWKILKDYNLNTEHVMLCTDYPDDAKEFFYEKVGLKTKCERKQKCKKILEM